MVCLVNVWCPRAKLTFPLEVIDYHLASGVEPVVTLCQSQTIVIRLPLLLTLARSYVRSSLGYTAGISGVLWGLHFPEDC